MDIQHRTAAPKKVMEAGGVWIALRNGKIKTASTGKMEPSFQKRNMPEENTTTFQKAGNAISKNPGKSATIVSGGLSIGAAMMLFATKGEIHQLNERQSETWRALQDVQVTLMRRAEATNSLRFAVETGRVGP